MTAAPQELAPIERVLRRQRAIVLAALAVLTLLAWAYLLAGAGTGMSVQSMSTVSFPPPRPSMVMAGPWNATYWLVMFLMWFVMMIAMMVPSAAPMILLHARVTRRSAPHGEMLRSGRTAAAFTTGYLLVWAGFAALATGLQWLLERTGLVDGMMMWSTERALTGALLIGAGIYQLTPWKNVCLSQCRSPAASLAASWRPGTWGALRMGLVHGSYCLGCCWGLMLLLFAGGIMNVIWIAALAIIVLVEKLVARGLRFSRLLAAALIASGLVISLS